MLLVIMRMPLYLKPNPVLLVTFSRTIEPNCLKRTGSFALIVLLVWLVSNLRQLNTYGMFAPHLTLFPATSRATCPSTKPLNFT